MVRCKFVMVSKHNSNITADYNSVRFLLCNSYSLYCLGGLEQVRPSHFRLSSGGIKYQMLNVKKPECQVN